VIGVSTAACEASANESTPFVSTGASIVSGANPIRRATTVTLSRADVRRAKRPALSVIAFSSDSSRKILVPASGEPFAAVVTPRIVWIAALCAAASAGRPTTNSAKTVNGHG
jgi:hypothetical protein